MTLRRWHILNRLIEQCGYSSYLEIGVSGGAAFKRVQVHSKIGVDPSIRLWSLFRRDVIKTTSDRFFRQNQRCFDLVFVDGLHHADQAYRDIRNALRCLNPGGTVVVHDCLPKTLEQQVIPRAQSSWTGDVWRAFLALGTDGSLETLVLRCETGCGIVRTRQRFEVAPDDHPGIRALDGSMSWEEFDACKQEWLDIVPEDRIFETLDRLADRGGLD